MDVQVVDCMRKGTNGTNKNGERGGWQKELRQNAILYSPPERPQNATAARTQVEHEGGSDLQNVETEQMWSGAKHNDTRASIYMFPNMLEEGV